MQSSSALARPFAAKVQQQRALAPTARARTSTVTNALSDVNVVIGGERARRPRPRISRCARAACRARSRPRLEPAARSGRARRVSTAIAPPRPLLAHPPLTPPACRRRPAGATIASLALGRFVFLPYHRRSLAKAGKPVQNGTTHYDAGDRLAEEVTFFTATNDPAGFSLIDVMAWGAIGHALGYYVLATSSLAALSRAPLPY